MKKNILWILALLLCFTFALPAHADAPIEDTTALDAFNAFSSTNNLSTAATADVLDEVMAGTFSVKAADQAAASAMAPALSRLSAVTSQEMLNYATANALPREQVRNAYYRALANVLRADLMVNPATETRYQNIQIILDLFLNGDGTDEVISETRKVIRKSMTPQHAATIAKDYSLPAGFVEFVIMDDDWDNDDWTDDTAWIAAGGYFGTDDYIATDDYLGTDDYTTTDIYVNTADRHHSPNSPDHYTPDHNTSDSPDYHTPNSPDYNTPDHHSSDRHSPDYHNSHD